MPAADSNILLRRSNNKTENGEHYRKNIFLVLLEEHEYQLCRDKGAGSIRNTVFNTVPNIILNWIVFRLVLSNGLPSRFTIAFSLIKNQGIMPYLHNFTQSGTEAYTTMLLSYIQNSCTLFEKRQKICAVYQFSRNDFHPIHIDMHKAMDSDFGKRSLAIKLTIRTTTMIDIL